MVRAMALRHTALVSERDLVSENPAVAATAPHVAPTGVILVTGAMAAGKSTGAQLLAERFPRAVHVRGDVFRRFVVTGRVDPTPDMPAEALVQLKLRYALATSTADAYARAGFTVVVQDVIIGALLRDVVQMIQTRPRFVVVLDPEPAAIATRAAARTKSGYVAGWGPDALVAQLRETTPRIGLWVDNTTQEPAATVQTILDRLDEARVDQV